MTVSTIPILESVQFFPSRRAHKQDGGLNLCVRRKDSSSLGGTLCSVSGLHGLENSNVNHVLQVLNRDLHTKPIQTATEPVNCTARALGDLGLEYECGELQSGEGNARL